MSLLETTPCIVLLAQDEIDWHNETGHLEMSLLERSDCIILLAQERVVDLILK